MTHYEGKILGFNYDIEKETETEFQEWLLAKLRRYLFADPLVGPVVAKLLGIDVLETRVNNLELEAKEP